MAKVMYWNSVRNYYVLFLLINSLGLQGAGGRGQGEGGQEGLLIRPRGRRVHEGWRHYHEKQ